MLRPEIGDPPMTPDALFTVGHSTHELPAFLALLGQHRVTAIADVRSVPHSRFAPQFNRDALERGLRKVGIKYVHLGKELGARTDDAGCYVDGKVQYRRLARTALFSRGIERLVKGVQSERIAVLCTESEPLDCHRTILVSRILAERSVSVSHVHRDGRLETHDAAMERLMARFGLDDADLFRSRTERLEDALSRQEERIGYVDEDLRTERTTRT
ncbi:DUF488 family protein [Amycolatopsis sp. NPDC051903]|uniref:DUF488 family protein n=1 Tax=Amycolatopsis sp. NPDC051903 TaxID=3363936 RepID=UPI00379728CB